MDWILMDEKKPEHRQKVIYYFRIVGVHRGTYLKEEDDDGFFHDVFVGSRGFLSDDVTHWMPDHGQELPPRPSGTATAHIKLPAW